MAGGVAGGAGHGGTPGTDGATADSGGAVAGMDGGYPDAKLLAAMILNDPDIAATKTLCDNILANGFTAGSGYPQVWIRDTNTFIEALLDKQPPQPMRAALLEVLRVSGRGHQPAAGGFAPRIPTSARSRATS